MIAPRNLTLGEEIYYGIDANEYLNEIYEALLKNYSIQVLRLPTQPEPINISDALRFADILSKSAGVPNSEKHKAWAQEIVALLRTLYPSEPTVAHYASSILTRIGNYRGLHFLGAKPEGFSFLEALFTGFDMDYLAIPHQDDKYFFHAQKTIFEHLNDEVFSYSGPTSMGKSLLMRTFIKDKIMSGSKENFAIIVPTKALISEISSSIIQDLTTELESKNYKVITSAGASMLKQPHNFIFVLTPERLLYLLIGNPSIRIDHLFIDEAHKISTRDGRSAFYYKVVDMLSERTNKPHIIFAAPNIPNPEVYLKLIPDATPNKEQAFHTSFSPVSQLKYFVDLIDKKIELYNEKCDALISLTGVRENVEPVDIIRAIVGDKKHGQSIVYFNSKDKAVDLAREYASRLQPKNDPQLETLAREIENEIHKTYYLADLIRCGVAYHIGYLPNHIRTSIEKNFRERKIDVLFCTSTLVEGVNLPADNLFVMSYKNGNHNMTAVDFRNLIGRVGRIEYNLYGNVFILRHSTKQKQEKFKELITKAIPNQEVSLITDLTRVQKEKIVDTLLSGDIEFKRYPLDQSEDSYSLMRKFGLILLRDIAKKRSSFVKEAFAEYLTPEKEETIRQIFLNAKAKTKPDDDINISVDQTKTLTEIIENGAAYPSLAPDGLVNYNDVYNFLLTLSSVFKWQVYESKTLGHISKKNGTLASLRWYATILTQWMNGHGLSAIISEGIRHKQQTFDSTVTLNGQVVHYTNSRLHQNAVIAETLSTIDHVILFSIANYFLRFSTEYKKFHKVDNFNNDWYEYVEYGSTSSLTIMLQRNGFSREASQYIRQNKSKYVIDTPAGPLLHMSILSCPKEAIRNEVADIRFNVPELFTE